MGIADFILLIDKFGWLGIIVVILFCVIQFIGSIVDIYQFVDFQRRLRRSNKIKKKIK
jgi:hypothetical protein